MIFKKNALFDFLKIITFLFLMAWAFIIYNNSDSYGKANYQSDYRQSVTYEKTATVLENILAWAGALSDLRLSQNIERWQQVKIDSTWQEAMSGNGLTMGSQGMNGGSWEELMNITQENIGADVNNITNIKEISWNDIKLRLTNSWQNIQEIYRKFTIIY